MRISVAVLVISLTPPTPQQINSNMLVLNSDATIAQSTCMALNEDHSGVLAVSIESTPDITTVNDAAVVAAATAADVNAENNSTAGGVKVN